MRIASIVVLTLALRIFAQSTGTESNNGSNLSTSSTTESDTLVSVAPTTTISEPENSGTTTTTSTTESPTATAPLLLEAVRRVFNHAWPRLQLRLDVKTLWMFLAFVKAYMSTAQICFNDSFCQNADVQNAIEDYGTVCRNGNQNSGTETSPRSTSPTPSRTRSRSDGLTSATTQTFVVTSGAVLTLSGGSTTRIVSDFTTTRTGQVGDFATDSTLFRGQKHPDPRVTTPLQFIS
ncbi:hypothetical protein RhiXN_07505 [Rhizoctonia solani]|uniref:Uncharacterized protein n=1 Tax=Rhizoctonia solani TaxID=456999 RepID=A0A8H8T0M3_9AGAM|nr:uncharacterized protein RhiXN_07505 [Rhizoctonia solani]QRW25556.1 hypothetical protein RhiXN_07505 [Rhizoctonia solani]